MDFEKTMLKSSQSYYINYLKYKINKYPFNELKISLKNILFDDRFQSKSKVFRIEVALRDSYGVVYDTFYRTIGDTNYRFHQTFESLIQPLEYSPLTGNTSPVTLNETFYLRIPTKSIDNLKKINLVFMIQTLENINSLLDKKVIKMKRASENLHQMSKFSYIKYYLGFRTE